MLNRRSFLTAAVATAFTAGCTSEHVPGSAASGPGTKGAALRIPRLARSSTDADGYKVFRLTLQADGRSRFLPGLTTATWGINGAYLGPTVRATRGDRVRMVITNRTPDPSTLHWHGMLLPAAMDGGPHQMIEPGATWSPQWTLDQPASSLWFHPHPHEATAVQVYRGLAGMFLVDEPGGPKLPDTYGVDDIPLIIQDKRFHEDGSLDEDDVDTGPYGFLGDVILINGTYRPVFKVQAQSVRFRLLNASSARVYQVGFSDGRTFHVVGTDSGLTEHPIAVKRLTLSPGERAEIVVRFTAGEETVMNSRGDDSSDIQEGDFDLLRLEAAPTLAASPPLPAALAQPAARPPAGATVRTFELSGTHNIDGTKMDMNRIDTVVPAGAREIWEVRNNGKAHNFHVHGADFRILDRAGQPPQRYETGPKDTVFVPPNSNVRLAVNFTRYTDPTGPYMYHCHILRHEDKGMMGQFVVVKPGTEQQTSRTLTGMDGMDHM
ncbi:multicopper oxidase family protein [Streptomyces formicae]|uniref:Multicopper oxidase CueO n=1 Tax=Streptomyces formicae TaxID=1616117 RepID=A0ABY3WPV8_9ACTN|nr:multicopper oxidase domain-containing protein [Streptomyces formicae]UNM14671.1 multicopper oxidase domain-containing protein [Streptomyces formicae]